MTASAGRAARAVRSRAQKRRQGPNQVAAEEDAAAEERYTRIRFQARPPEHTLATIRSRYGVGPDNASSVVAANVYSFLRGLRLPVLPEDGYDVFGWAHEAHLRYQEALAQHRAINAAAAVLR